jgi:hypothetical protein
MNSIFRLQYASNLFVDLHKLPFEKLIKPRCANLALLGNIGNPNDAKTYHFLNYCSRNWDKTLWVSGSHERKHSSVGEANPMNQLTKEFENVRCLDAEEQIFHSENTVVLGLPPESPSLFQKMARPDLTHALLRTVFWNMTHPMANIIILRSTGTEKNLIPLRGSKLEAPVSLWILGNATSNSLSTDSSGTKLFATNRYFTGSSLTPVPSYSPTAFVEIVDSSGKTQKQYTKQPYQLAFSA